MFIDYVAVAFEIGQFPVEGKKLLEVSRFKNTPPPNNTIKTEHNQALIQRRFRLSYISIRKHISCVARGLRIRKQAKYLRFTISLLMLPIIPTPPAIPILPPELANDPVMAMRLDQIIQEKRISAIENQVQLMTTGAPIGWAILTRIRKMYGFSKQKRKRSLKHMS
ncbi:hypothetical protein BCU59_21415 [Vibrio cyclitrophicus]|nr:hypothetical protein BCU59_21415 [Vibrio cyclitrophicus]